VRFKYLTATILRNAAIQVEENDFPMCWAVRDQIGSFNWFEDGGSEEFEGLLKDMDVPLNGWLWLDNAENRRGRFWDSDPELKAVRVLFLLMLADAIAYKPNGGKKRKSSPPPMILPDRGMVFEHRRTPHDEYEARNHYGTFLVRRENITTGEWQMLDPNGQVIDSHWSRGNLFGKHGCKYSNVGRPPRC